MICNNSIRSISGLALMTLLFLSSCSNVFYNPIDELAPILENEGEAQLGIGISGHNPLLSIFSRGSNPSIQVNAASSPLQRLGIYGKYSHQPSISDKVDSGLFGIGYYEHLNDRFQFQFYGLTGIESRQFQGDDETFLSLTKKSFGIQPGFNYFNNILGISLTTTIKRVWNKNLSGSRLWRYEIPDYLNYIEPTLSFFIKTRVVQLDLRINRSFVLEQNDLFHLKGYGSIGLMYKLDARK